MPLTAQANILITVDRSAQRMSVSVDGEPRWNWPVSTGRAGYATPAGSYTAFRMEAEHFSKEFDDAPMPHSVFFTKMGHAIHGYYDVKHLGQPVSHGCVRLSPANAAKLYALVEQEGLPNTKVVITGAQPDAAPLVARRDAPRAAQRDAYGQPMQIGPQGRVYDSNARGYYYGYGTAEDSAPRTRSGTWDNGRGYARSDDGWRGNDDDDAPAYAPPVRRRGGFFPFFDVN
jgi:hypothetical protein